jgi:hypothetical protein
MNCQSMKSQQAEESVKQNAKHILVSQILGHNDSPALLE